MNKRKQCNEVMDDHRYHLGYTECIDCSDEEKYSAHQVYPHKTGGYVQPIKKSQSDNLKRLDRRSVGSGKPAKGIMKDNSWDRKITNDLPCHFHYMVSKYDNNQIQYMEVVQYSSQILELERKYNCISPLHAGKFIVC